MSSKADFIKISAEDQTMPTEPENRFKESEIRTEECEVEDLDQIAECIYSSFPESWWANKEPPELRPPEQITRQQRLAKRLRPTFSMPHMHWIKAVLASTGKIIGIAGWIGPGTPIYNFWRRSAVEYYGWQAQMGWTDAEVEDIWRSMNLDVWERDLAECDDDRRKILGDEPHWYLAPVCVFPEFQGRGVAKRLMNWAIERADATVPPTPMYLESAPSARAMHMHLGFVPQGKVYFLRRGPRVIRGLEAEGTEDGTAPTERVQEGKILVGFEEDSAGKADVAA